MDAQQAPPAGGTSPDDGLNSVPAPAPGPAADKGEKSYTAHELEQIVKDRLERQQRALTAKAEADAKAAREAEQAAQGQYKDVADQRAARIAELEAQTATLQRQIWIAQHGADLPAALAARVTGTTEAEIQADCAELRKLLAPPPAPKTEAGRGLRPQPAGPPAGTPGARYSWQGPNDVKW